MSPRTTEQNIKIRKESKQKIMDAYDRGEFNQGCNGSSEEYYNKEYEQSI